MLPELGSTADSAAWQGFGESPAPCWAESGREFCPGPWCPFMEKVKPGGQSASAGFLEAASHCWLTQSRWLMEMPCAPHRPSIRPHCSHSVPPKQCFYHHRLSQPRSPAPIRPLSVSLYIFVSLTLLIQASMNVELLPAFNCP